MFEPLHDVIGVFEFAGGRESAEELVDEGEMEDFRDGTKIRDKSFMPNNDPIRGGKEGEKGEVGVDRVLVAGLGGLAARGVGSSMVEGWYGSGWGRDDEVG